MRRVMSRVSSEPRGRLKFQTPSAMLLAVFGDDARTLIDAFGVEELGRDKLDLAPGRVERACAKRGEAPPAG